MRLQFVLHAHLHRLGTQEESTLTSRSIALAVCLTGICFLQKARAAVCLLAFTLSPAFGWTSDADDQGGVEEIVVKATRTATLIRDEPLRVEAVPAEEIEENLTIQPGNLSSLLNELPGIRVQSAAPGLGGAGLQLRGMPTRHNLVLTDGLPLLGAEPDAFVILQTPPLDLAREDVSGDGWADLPSYRRFTLRPRVWWDGGQGRSLFLTAGFTDENREGGTLPGRVLPGGSAFPEALRTRRFDCGAVSQWMLADGLSLSGRVSLASTHLDRTFGTQRIASTQTTVFGEEALIGNHHGHAWVLGLAFERDELAVPTVPGVSYTYNVPALFAQDEFAPTTWLKFAGSARVDAHNDYGTFLHPRLSALVPAPAS